MASTYVNDLRLNEMATGDGSGTWGTTTNTNLELIAEAFSYGTEVITTNADTHTTTIADGATDPGRSLYLKYTGTLDSACTITIGPNTVSKVWIIENGTSGSQDIIISQGSGANITIPAGDTKVVYSDGAGAGAAFVDAFASLSVVDLKVQDDLTVTGDIDVDGTTNLDVVDIDGAVDMASTLTVTGEIVANGGIALGDNDIATFGAGDDLQIYHDGDSSYISHNTSGSDLVIEATSPGDDVIVRAADDLNLRVNGNDNGINIVGLGATTLYHAGNSKLATTATGIDVTGAVDADKLSIDTGATNVTIDSGGIYNSLNTTGVTYIVADSNAQAGLFAYGITHATKPNIVEIKAGGSVKATIDSSGNVGIGTSSPDDDLHIANTTQAGATFRLENTNTSTDTNTTFGTINFEGNDDSAGASGIRGSIVGKSLSTNGAMGLLFSTASAGGANTERMRIDSSGNLLVGATSSTLTGVDSKLLVSAASGSVFGSINSESIVNNQQTGIIIRGEVSGAQRTGSIAVYKHSGIASAAAYLTLTPQDGALNYYWTDDTDDLRTSATAADVGTTNGTVVGDQTSDERLKDIEAGFEYGLAEIMQLVPIAYSLKEDPTAVRKLGFGAQTTRSILPELVYDTGNCLDGYDVDPDDSMVQTPRSDATKLAMQYVQAVPVLVKAIQEQQALIESLTARITTLEG
jgi:hypothetical protein